MVQCFCFCHPLVSEQTLQNGDFLSDDYNEDVDNDDNDGNNNNENNKDNYLLVYFKIF